MSPVLFLFPPVMALLSRMSGGGLFASRIPSFLPEVLFALGFGLGAHLLGYPWYVVVLSSVWSYIWMQTGHGTAFKMGREPDTALSGRKQTLSYVVDPICKALGRPLGEGLYCWVFMGTKGLLIGLPVAPFGLLLGILWPIGYEIGYQARERVSSSVSATATGEMVTGFFAGAVILLQLLVS